MQLVAYGAQDIYLTGNPQITFFKVVYRRHTNFSMETIQQTINGTPRDGGNSTVTISRNGDLVYKVYVTLAATNVTKGSNIVSEVELEIGGQRIDRHYEEWMNIWNELSTPESKAIGLKAMQCDVGTGVNTGVGNVQVPLQFWFCRNPGLALPLIALQYHEVKLKFTWGSSHGGTVSGAQVWCDYIYLDTDERRRFAQVSHEYLIEQIQRETPTGALGDTKLNFNHPVKELIWTSDQDYTDAKLVLNGHDRFASQETEYFQLRQPFDYHTAVPRQNLPTRARDYGLSDWFRHTYTKFGGTQSEGEGDGVFEADDTPLNEKFSITTTKTLKLGTSAAPTGETESVNSLKKGDIIMAEVTVANIDGSGSSGLTLNGFGDQTAAETDRQVLVHLQKFFAVVDSVSYIGSDNEVTITLRDGFVRSDGAVTITTLNSSGGTDAKLKFYTSNFNVDTARTSQMTDKINVYSFGLKPEEHQPSGTCNFSRIDNAKLNFTADPHSGTMSIYAVNYNVLRIMSGMGGLAYSN